MRNRVDVLVSQVGYRDTELRFAQKFTRLAAMPLACGVSRASGSRYDWNGLQRGEVPYVCLQYTLAGEGVLVFEGRKLAVRPGSAMLLYFPHDHRYFCAPGKRWEFLHVSLYGREILRLWRELVDRVGPIVAMDSAGPSVEQLTTLCERALTGQLTSPFAASALAWNLAMAVLEETTPPASAAMPAWAARVARHCRTHLRKPIGVEDMARRAGLSRYHFSRVFRATFGVTPGRYLDELRLKEALRALHDTSWSITEVAERCGYSDRNYFSKAFRKQYGLAPSAVRRNRDDAR